MLASLSHRYRTLHDRQTTFLPSLRTPRLCASGRAAFGCRSVVHAVRADGAGCALVAVHLTAALQARHAPADEWCFAADACGCIAAGSG